MNQHSTLLMLRKMQIKILWNDSHLVDLQKFTVKSVTILNVGSVVPQQKLYPMVGEC